MSSVNSTQQTTLVIEQSFFTEMGESVNTTIDKVGDVLTNTLTDPTNRFVDGAIDVTGLGIKTKIIGSVPYLLLPLTPVVSSVVDASTDGSKKTTQVLVKKAIGGTVDLSKNVSKSCVQKTSQRSQTIFEYLKSFFI